MTNSERRPPSTIQLMAAAAVFQMCDSAVPLPPDWVMLVGDCPPEGNGCCCWCSNGLEKLARKTNFCGRLQKQSQTLNYNSIVIIIQMELTAGPGCNKCCWWRHPATTVRSCDVACWPCCRCTKSNTFLPVRQLHLATTGNFCRWTSNWPVAAVVAVADVFGGSRPSGRGDWPAIGRGRTSSCCWFGGRPKCWRQCKSCTYWPAEEEHTRDRQGRSLRSAARRTRTRPSTGPRSPTSNSDSHSARPTLGNPTGHTLYVIKLQFLSIQQINLILICAGNSGQRIGEEIITGECTIE